jgi:NitT/TauT family transport system ATP-binding protein
MALIELAGVGKRYEQGTVALQDLSLVLQPGEFVSFLGPSGCGKSTALRLIAGLLAPTSGSIQRSGVDEIGFVFQEATLMPWACVADNVSLPLRLKHLSRQDISDRVRQALALVGLESFATVYPRELSGGMKMRVSIARALVTQPRLLLMDEPFAALDEISRFKLNNDLLALWRQLAFTVVFVTHSVYESVYLSNRIVVMAPRPGRVVADVAIDAPYPRNDEFRTAPEYGRLCRTVSGHLHGALAATENARIRRANDH